MFYTKELFSRSTPSQILLINFAKHLQEWVVFNKLNMGLPPNNLIQRSLLIQIKPNLNPFIVLNSRYYIHSHLVYFRVLCLWHYSCGIVRDELILWWRNQHDFLEPADIVALGQSHHEGVFFCDWLEVQFLDVFDLVDLWQVPDSKIDKGVLGLWNSQMWRCQRYQSIHHVLVFWQVFETSSSNDSAQTETYEIDPLDIFIRVNDKELNFWGNLFA